MEKEAKVGFPWMYTWRGRTGQWLTSIFLEQNLPPLPSIAEAEGLDSRVKVLSSRYISFAWTGGFHQRQ